MGEKPREPEEKSQEDSSFVSEAYKDITEKRLRQKRIKEEDPKAIAEEKKDKEALHKKIWGGAKKAKVEEEQNSEKIIEEKLKLEKLYTDSVQPEKPKVKGIEEVEESNKQLFKKAVAHDKARMEKLKTMSLEERLKYLDKEREARMQAENEKWEKRFKK